MTGGNAYFSAHLSKTSALCFSFLILSLSFAFVCSFSCVVFLDFHFVHATMHCTFFPCLLPTRRSCVHDYIDLMVSNRQITLVHFEFSESVTVFFPLAGKFLLFSASALHVCEGFISLSYACFSIVWFWQNWEATSMVHVLIAFLYENCIQFRCFLWRVNIDGKLCTNLRRYTNIQIYWQPMQPFDFKYFNVQKKNQILKEICPTNASISMQFGPSLSLASLKTTDLPAVDKLLMLVYTAGNSISFECMVDKVQGSALLFDRDSCFGSEWTGTLRASGVFLFLRSIPANWLTSC